MLKLEYKFRNKRVGRYWAGSSKVVPGEKVEGVIKEDGPEGDPDTPVITLAQRMRLLSGYYRITHMVPPPHSPRLDRSPSCGATWQRPGCSQSFAEPEIWKGKTRAERVVGLRMEDKVEGGSEGI